MYQKKLGQDIRCPLEYARGLLGGKWKTRIICLLGNVHPLRFGELKTELIDVSDGVLGLSLNELAKDGLVCKDNEMYNLTEKGKSLLPILRQLCQWSGKYYKENSDIVMSHCRKCDYYKEWEAAIDNISIYIHDNTIKKGNQ